MRKEERGRLWRSLLAGAVLLMPAATLRSVAQESDVEPVPTLLPASPIDLLFPAVYRAGYRTRIWLRDSLSPADSTSDLDRVDLIWSRALEETGGDLDHALFATLMAVFEHRTIPFTFGLVLPLTLEPIDEFKVRYARLPSHLFADRPVGGDQDKLQHFFASAWLARTLDNRSMADVSGWGIEIGEALFIKGGANDPRDVRANRLGQGFAALLRIYPDAMPSAMFRAWNREYSRRSGGG